MIFGSVCSGIEAASVAWHALGWRAAFLSEIAPFPSAVLAHHYPNVPNLGDMTNYQAWAEYGISLLVAGTPCQSFSRAGERRGLDDPRGDLALTYLAIARRYTPRWVVWENVPGVLSSNDGRDFGTFIGGLAKCGYGFAYRMFDARYFGLAQRRRRLFVVGYFGNWRPAAAVLFEREGMRRDSPQAIEKELEGTALDAGAFNRRWWNGDSVSQTLDAVLHKKQAMPEKNRFPAVIDDGRFRFITPCEAERLQGFPDEYTAIPYRGRLATDAVRYQAIGNSMPVPVMRWIGERIQFVDSIMEGSKNAGISFNGKHDGSAARYH